MELWRRYGGVLDGGMGEVMGGVLNGVMEWVWEGYGGGVVVWGNGGVLVGLIAGIVV